MVYRIGRKYRIYLHILVLQAMGYRESIARNCKQHRKDGTETLVFSMIEGMWYILPNRPDRPWKEWLNESYKVVFCKDWTDDTGMFGRILCLYTYSILSPLFYPSKVRTEELNYFRIGYPKQGSDGVHPFIFLGNILHHFLPPILLY